MVFSVTQLYGGKRCLGDKEALCGVSLSDDLSIVFLLPLRLFPPSTLFPLLLCLTRCFPSVKEGAETYALSCRGCYNMTYGQSPKAQRSSMRLLHGWSTSISTQRGPARSVGSLINAEARLIHPCSSHYET